MPGLALVSTPAYPARMTRATTKGTGAAIEHAEVVLPAAPLDETLTFFVEVLGFRVASISPADEPRTAVLAGHGLRIRLDPDATEAGTLRLGCTTLPEERELEAPNGTRVELVLAQGPMEVPELRPSLSIARLEEAAWKTGRAGMRYRDLLLDRQGGRFAASHIKVERDGPVPDYVHHHRVRFQIIFAWRGRVRLAYEGQGPDFVMEAGDCILQPSGIRHRVLESHGLEVVELASPARHETHGDLELELPTPRAGDDAPERVRRFLHHRRAEASVTHEGASGFEVRTIGLAGPTDGLAEARVLRSPDSAHARFEPHGGELLFRFVLDGGLSVELATGETVALVAGDALAVPPDLAHTVHAEPGAELFEVRLPAPR